MHTNITCHIEKVLKLTKSPMSARVLVVLRLSQYKISEIFTLNMVTIMKSGDELKKKQAHGLIYMTKSCFDPMSF
jgi:hypothetical protein